MKEDFYFENENVENIPPVSFNEEEKNRDVEIDFSETFENNVDNSNNVINNRIFDDTAENSQFQNVFQPNYYRYQQSYQHFNKTPFQSEEQIKLYIEKGDVKKTSNIIGVGLILFMAVNLVISFIFPFLSINKEVADFIRDPAVLLELNLLLSVLSFGLAGIFILKSQNLKASSIISYGPPKKQGFLPAILTGIGFCYTANIVVSMIQVRFQSVLPFAEPEIELPTGVFGFALGIISVALAPALIEEFLFRSVIMGSLLKFGKGFAIFTSAFLFGLVHGNLIQIPFAFLVGIVIGAMVVETNSIWTGVIIHFINNLISVLLQYSKNIIDENIINVLYLFLIAFFIIVGFFAFHMLSLKNKDLFNYKMEKNNNSSALQKFGWLASTASIIVYFVAIILEIIATQITTG